MSIWELTGVAALTALVLILGSDFLSRWRRSRAHLRHYRSQGW